MLKFRSIRILLAGAGAALGAACIDFPSEPPKFEELFVVRAVDLFIGAADLVPDLIAVNGDSSAFVLVSDSTTFTANLGQMCGACVTANGTTIAKPAFNYTFSNTIPQPTDLVSAQITGGTITLKLVNNLGFDPIRPSATARGSMTVTLRRGTTAVASYVMNGNTIDFPNGIQRTVNIPLSAFVFDQALTAEVNIDSPAGDPVLINTANSVTIIAGPVRTEIGQITVNVASQSFGDTNELDLSDMDTDLGDRVQGGGIRLRFENPFNVGGDFSLVVTGPGVSITKSITMAANATSTNRVSLTADEIRSLLGKVVEVQVNGSFSAPGGQLTLTPAQVALISTDLELAIQPIGD